MSFKVFLFVAFAGKKQPKHVGKKNRNLKKFQVRSMDVRRNFSKGETRYFAHPFHVADDAMQMHVHKTFCPFYTITKMPHAAQGRNEGGKGGTIPQAPNHYGGANRCGGRHKVPTMSQILSSIQYICYGYRFTCIVDLTFRIVPTPKGKPYIGSSDRDYYTCASFHTAWKCVTCRYHQPVTGCITCHNVYVQPQCCHRLLYKNHSIHKKIN